MKLCDKYGRGILLTAGMLFMLSQPVLAASIELSLEDSIALALKNNESMQIAEISREKSAWAIKQAQAGKGVAITYIHSDTRSDATPSFLNPMAYPTVPAYNYSSNKLSASLPLYTGGKLESIINQAKLGLKASDLTIDATKQQLRLSTTMAYYTVLQCRNMLDIAKQSEAAFAAHLENVQHMYNEGVVAYPDVLQTKVQLANAQDRLVKAQNGYNLAVYDLNNVMGLPLHSAIQLKEDLKNPLPSGTLDDSINYALAHRPEIAIEQVSVHIAKDQIKIAASDKRPTVALTGSNTWFDKEFAGTKYKNWAVTVAAQFNVFDSGNTNAQIKQAEAGVAIAKKQEQQAIDSISLEVSKAYLSMKEAEKRIETSKTAVEEAEVNFKLSQRRYSEGIGTNLDVMDAELALAQAKTNFVQALYDYNTSKAQLDKAMGMTRKE
jgi:outer membrane protein